MLKGREVRDLVLINPQNPLGDLYSWGPLKEYLELAKRCNLRVIIDEIYMLSVLDDYIIFHSVLGMESSPGFNRAHVI
ncbi:hypothetical protein E2I00_001819 [Balaenoptera physalus]|uniref:Aminotransferase class I/classII large domain-containing protein n=1 Tax=Balaenoptera physalus TaxID=9770 RepID=A0A643CB38_BALPH|nr:hypothetical protein E2I00_001819 [Balaenoptera physalus]